jgi:hypothetical protein
MKIQRILLSACLLAGCASQPTMQPEASSAQDVIMMAARAAPGPVRATVTLQVRAVGSQSGMTYLNSEDDYRDQRNISIEIAPAALANLESTFGGALATAAVGKRIVVKGPAQRVTIWFFDKNGARTDKYYYQTHILVSDPSQIQLI